jgi:hypothetical protein
METIFQKETILWQTNEALIILAGFIKYVYGFL